jgi:hypothetical protein
MKRRRSDRLTLDDLPLFASDEDLAVAIVGPERAGDFLKTLPTLERRGFPPRSEAFGGRYVPLVRDYFEATVRGAFAVTGNGVVRDGPEGPWPTGRRKRRTE